MAGYVELLALLYFDHRAEHFLVFHLDPLKLGPCVGVLILSMDGCLHGLIFRRTEQTFCRAQQLTINRGSLLVESTNLSKILRLLMHSDAALGQSYSAS